MPRGRSPLSAERLRDAEPRPDSPGTGLTTRARTEGGRGRGSISPAAAAICLYVFMVISRVNELIPFATALRPMVLLGATAVVLAFMLPQSRAYALLRPIEARAVVGMLALIALSIPLSYWPGASVGALVSFVKTLIYFFLLVYCIRTRRELRLALWAYLAATASLEVMVILAKAVERIRVTGTYDPNDLAFVMVCAIPLAVMLFFAERGPWRWVLPPLVLLAMLTIILSKSRGGFVGLVVAGLVVLAKLPSRGIPFLRTGIAVGAIVAFTTLAPASYWERISSIWDGQQSSDGYLREGLQAARWEIWKRGLQAFLQNPITGVGAGAFGAAEGAFGGRFKNAHSSFVQITTELGIGGLALFAFLLYRTIINCRAVSGATRRARPLASHYWMAQAIEASLWGYIVAGAALSQAYSETLYFLVAMSVVLRRLTAARLQARPQPAQGARPSLDGTPWWKRRG